MSYNVNALKEYINNCKMQIKIGKQYINIDQLGDEYLTYMLIYILYTYFDEYDYNPIVISVAVHEFNKYCLSDIFIYIPEWLVLNLSPELDHNLQFVKYWK